MKSLEQRIERLENRTKSGEPEVFLTCVYEEGDNPEREQMKALKAYNDEHGTTLPISDVSWVLCHVVTAKQVQRVEFASGL